MKINQLSIFLENRAGTLSEVTNLLAENGIDLRAINIAETSDYGVLRVITNDSERSLMILKDHGFIATKTEVLAVGVPDQPGGLAKLLAALAKEKIDVEYMYSIFGQPNGLATMILRVDDIEYVRDTIEKYDLHAADGAELGIA